MRCRIVVVAGVLLVGLAGAAFAQRSGGLEITPHVGYRWGGSLSSISGIRDFDTKDNISYGVGLATLTPHRSAVELDWTHFEGDIKATLNSGARVTGPKLKRDDIMLNGTWYAVDPSKPIMPYFTFGLGASIFDTEKTSSIGRFAWNIGIGLRRDLSERTALRVQGTWVPTWITTGSGIWCDPFFCYSVGTGEYYDQFEVQGGLTLKL